MLHLDGRSLRLTDLLAVADARRPVSLSPEARARMVETRAVVDRAVDRGAPVYGINTGFGKLSEVTIPLEQLTALQRNLVRSHAAGVGDPLPEREVRAMMLLRANVLATAYAGARPDVVDTLLGMLNTGIWPVVPEQGSVGASGDLAPLAHLALALIGEGPARFGDREDLASVFMTEVGLTPVTLAAKEGLALINGTQAHTAVAGLACAELIRLWGIAHVATAMTLEALLGTPDAFDARIQEARGQLGQAESAALLRVLLGGSEIRESHRFGDPRVQDAYALRCVPQVHGPALDALRFTRDIIERELNAATDNPLVLATGELLSGGNFHGQAVGMASDMLAIITANLAVISERRIDRLVHPDFNQGLPPFLAASPGLESGHMMSQVTAAALASECKLLAHPASVDSIPTDGNKEDVVPMAMNAALKLRRSVRNLRHVLAIELIAGAEALEHRRPLRSSMAVEAAHALVRAQVAPASGDRSPAPDIARLGAAMASGAFDSLTTSVVI
ncbi:histidine ammonia-lyase [Gemmatimonas phototrophica]|uniref:Histidine ammonia-lyase n=1 Tax=Gemmatimonas phototrophica TaxID=1379270 RepID=A0A143BJ88_9BACT|nr:histidine ammonia-lyase [Gemmatimonas phototrophica]AMW05078.1 histidine ammonia-lyase [Gemmatimonas phototrophica]